MKSTMTYKMFAGSISAGALALAISSTPLYAANPCNPCVAKNPSAAKAAVMNPCAAKNPCATKNPCAAKAAAMNPCAAKNPCSAKHNW